MCLETVVCPYKFSPWNSNHQSHTMVRYCETLPGSGRVSVNGLEPGSHVTSMATNATKWRHILNLQLAKKAQHWGRTVIRAVGQRIASGRSCQTKSNHLLIKTRQKTAAMSWVGEGTEEKTSRVITVWLQFWGYSRKEEERQGPGAYTSAVSVRSGCAWLLSQDQK